MCRAARPQYVKGVQDTGAACLAYHVTGAVVDLALQDGLARGCADALSASITAAYTYSSRSLVILPAFATAAAWDANDCASSTA